jgi:hypothetical protein
MRNSAARANIGRDGEEKQQVQKDTWYSEDEGELHPPLINFDRYHSSQPFPPPFNHRNTQFDKPQPIPQFLQPPEPPPPPPSPNTFSYNITPPPNPFNVTPPPPASLNPFSFNNNHPRPFGNVFNPLQPSAFYHPPMIIPPQIVYHPPMVIPTDTPTNAFGAAAPPAENPAIANIIGANTGGIDYGGDADQLSEALREAMAYRCEVAIKRERSLVAQESDRIYRAPRVRKIRSRQRDGGEEEMMDVIVDAALRGRRERVKKKRKRGIHREVTPGSKPEVMNEGDKTIDWWPTNTDNSMDWCEEHPHIMQLEQQRHHPRQKVGL